MEELIPAGCGFLLGAAVGRVKVSLRLPLAAPLAVALGAFATVVTGEATASLAFVLIDIPIVAVAALRPEERRRQFEDSRGLSGRPALPLDDDEGTGEDEEPSPDENERDAEGDEQ